MPTGWLNRAADPVPSVVPTLPAVPARVVTTPAEVILRIVALFRSVTNTLPEPSTAMPNGWLKSAAVPVASVEPKEVDEPARVDTTPAGVILRTVLLAESAT